MRSLRLCDNDDDDDDDDDVVADNNDDSAAAAVHSYDDSKVHCNYQRTIIMSTIMVMSHSSDKKEKP